MINPNEWLRTRKNLLDEVKSQVRVRLGPMPPLLSRYAKSMEGEFRGVWRSCSIADLQRAIKKAKIVLGADFHAYAQAQREHFRILRDLSHPKVILALECLSHDKEHVAAEFIAGRISEDQFLEASQWSKHWGFPWEGYRPLFELARDRGYEIRGLYNPKLQQLKRRDEWMARRLTTISHSAPDSLIYVVIGEWHVARPHLPAKLKRSFKGNDDLLVLFQDIEKLYFQLASKKQEGRVDCLKGADNRYCLMVSPPWMKWQSYLMYLEQAYDRDLQEDLAIDYTDHVASLIELLEGDLKVHVSKAHIQVYCPSSKTSLSRLKLTLPKRFSKALVYHLEHDLSFYIPEKEWLYLSRATINHASALAGQFLHAHLSRRTRTLWDLPADFLPLIWIEALGFFFSKWINPKRKCETLDSIRVQLSARDPKDEGRPALLLALDHRLTEVVYFQSGRLRSKRYKPRRASAYFEASRIVGGMLGERLFQKVRSGTISLRQLMSYLEVNVEDKDFSKFYWNMVRNLESPRRDL